MQSVPASKVEGCNKWANKKQLDYFYKYMKLMFYFFKAGEDLRGVSICTQAHQFCPWLYRHGQKAQRRRPIRQEPAPQGSLKFGRCPGRHRAQMVPVTRPDNPTLV